MASIKRVSKKAVTAKPASTRKPRSKAVASELFPEKEMAEIKAQEAAQLAEIKAQEAARNRNASGRAAVEALRKKAKADFVAATRGESAEPVGPDLGPGPKQTRDYLPEGLQPRLEKTMGEKIKPFAVGGGLAALAGLGVARGVDAYNTNRAAQDIRFDTERQERESLLAGLVNQGRERSLQNAIQANLAEVQRQSPFLYNQVAAGRVLPQGAVVLGGRTRQDLLQELGRSMSEGQFSQ
jgi:hypothetical protein